VKSSLTSKLRFENDTTLGKCVLSCVKSDCSQSSVIPLSTSKRPPTTPILIRPTNGLVLPPTVAPLTRPTVATVPIVASVSSVVSTSRPIVAPIVVPIPTVADPIRSVSPIVVPSISPSAVPIVANHNVVPTVARSTVALSHPSTVPTVAGPSLVPTVALLLSVPTTGALVPSVPTAFMSHSVALLPSVPTGMPIVMPTVTQRPVIGPAATSIRPIPMPTTALPTAAVPPVTTIAGPRMTTTPTLEMLEGLRPQHLAASRPPSGPLSPTAVCWNPTSTKRFDELDALVNAAAELFVNSASWNDFVPKVRDSRGDFNPLVEKIPHPSAHLLNRFRINGAPVACKGLPWSFAQKAAALTRGPHQSARKHVPFLRQEFVDIIRKGQWTLLPARLVLNDLQLRLSPLGVVPQRDRRPRTISDYSFFGINHETLDLSPGECMQFGRALQRVLQHLKSANPHLGPVYLSKIDIADGFYRIWVRASDVPKLGVLFPTDDGEEYLAGFPLALPMGWTESPKIFTAATETVADLTNTTLSSGAAFGPHHLEVQSETPPLPILRSSQRCPPRGGHSSSRIAASWVTPGWCRPLSYTVGPLGRVR
jgi:hypothetical protein